MATLVTAREAEILDRVICGLTNVQIARDLGCSHKTVENHITHINVKNRLPLLPGPTKRVSLAVWWLQRKLVQESTRWQ